MHRNRQVTQQNGDVTRSVEALQIFLSDESFFPRGHQPNYYITADNQQYIQERYVKVQEHASRLLGSLLAEHKAAYKELSEKRDALTRYYRTSYNKLIEQGQRGASKQSRYDMEQFEFEFQFKAAFTGINATDSMRNNQVAKLSRVFKKFSIWWRTIADYTNKQNIFGLKHSDRDKQQNQILAALELFISDKRTLLPTIEEIASHAGKITEKRSDLRRRCYSLMAQLLLVAETPIPAELQDGARTNTHSDRKRELIDAAIKNVTQPGNLDNNRLNKKLSELIKIDDFLDQYIADYRSQRENGRRWDNLEETINTALSDIQILEHIGRFKSATDACEQQGILFEIVRNEFLLGRRNLKLSDKTINQLYGPAREAYYRLANCSPMIPTTYQFISQRIGAAFGKKRKTRGEIAVIREKLSNLVAILNRLYHKGGITGYDNNVYILWHDALAYQIEKGLRGFFGRRYATHSARDVQILRIQVELTKYCAHTLHLPNGQDNYHYHLYEILSRLMSEIDEQRRWYEKLGSLWKTLNKRIPLFRPPDDPESQTQDMQLVARGVEEEIKRKAKEALEAEEAKRREELEAEEAKRREELEILEKTACPMKRAIEGYKNFILENGSLLTEKSFIKNTTHWFAELSEATATLLAKNEKNPDTLTLLFELFSNARSMITDIAPAFYQSFLNLVKKQADAFWKPIAERSLQIAIRLLATAHCEDHYLTFCPIPHHLKGLVKEWQSLSVAGLWPASEFLLRTIIEDVHFSPMERDLYSDSLKLDQLRLIFNQLNASKRFSEQLQSGDIKRRFQAVLSKAEERFSAAVEELSKPPDTSIRLDFFPSPRVDEMDDESKHQATKKCS